MPWEVEEPPPPPHLTSTQDEVSRTNLLDLSLSLPLFSPAGGSLITTVVPPEGKATWVDFPHCSYCQRNFHSRWVFTNRNTNTWCSEESHCVPTAPRSTEWIHGKRGICWFKNCRSGVQDQDSSSLRFFWGLKPWLAERFSSCCVLAIFSIYTDKHTDTAVL